MLSNSDKRRIVIAFLSSVTAILLICYLIFQYQTIDARCSVKSMTYISTNGIIIYNVYDKFDRLLTTTDVKKDFDYLYQAQDYFKNFYVGMNETCYLNTGSVYWYNPTMDVLISTSTFGGLTLIVAGWEIIMCMRSKRDYVALNV